MGAGASRADGYPIISELSEEALRFVYDDKNKKNSVSKFESEWIDKLRLFYKTLYGIDLAPTEDKTKQNAPSIVETISLIDIALNETIGTIDSGRENGVDLHLVKKSLIYVITRLFSKINQKKGHASTTKLFIAKKIKEFDVIITTNWDCLVDQALHQKVNKKPNYGLAAEYVYAGGNPIEHYQKDSVIKLYKIHGSLSWLYCDRCQRLYINTQLFDPAKYIDFDCSCGHLLEPLIVPPSFIKKYNNTWINEVWRLALDELVRSNHWVFIGYSLPEDDIWIRLLLIRVAIIRRKKCGLNSTSLEDVKIEVVTLKPEQDEEWERFKKRYLTLFGRRANDPNMEFHVNGFLEYLKKSPT